MPEHHLRPARLALATLAATATLSPAVEPRTAHHPDTPRHEVREQLHGVELADPYRWLEDQWSPDTRAWIAAQNAHTDAVLASLPQRAVYRQRLSELLKVDNVGVPTERAGRYFYLRRRPDQEQQVLVMRHGLDGAERVLVDPHPWSPERTTSITVLDVAADGGRVVYGVREGGQDEVVVRLLDVGRGKDVGPPLRKGRYSSVVLTRDGNALLYARHSQATGPRIYVHRVGEDPAADREIFGQGYGPETIMRVTLSDDRRSALITVYHGSAADQTEVYVLDAGEPGARPPSPIVNDVKARFLPDAAGGRIYLQTNWQAPRGRILAVDIASPARAGWREVVPEARASLQSVTLAGGRLFAEYLDDVRSQVKVFEPDGRFVREIAFPAPGKVSDFSGRWDGPDLFFAFQSFHRPPSIYRHQAAGGEQAVWWRTDLPFDSEAFELGQHWYVSRDGTRIPMFVVHRKGLRLDGSHPALLTGYGGFTQSQTPTWSSRAAAWIEAGGVYALPSLRGGGEFGEEWHRAGMRDRKQNVFDDFIAAAEWLVSAGYTRPERLAVAGRSNGGLLVGAAMTQRPDLFAAVVCGYPLLDMVRYHRFLVARFWVPEYGSADEAEQFKYLLAYSPYHNVRQGVRYPAVLFVTGDGDTRVDPLHARKMAALMQASTGSEQPVLLHYDTKAGHSAGVPVAQQVDDLADELAFVAWRTGLEVRRKAASAATVPLRTAPSMVAGSPVSVQSPAR